MKHPFTSATLALLSLGFGIHAQQLPPYEYNGPQDETLWTGFDKYSWSLAWTTLGQLAPYSDFIGVGQVTQTAELHFTVTVDHALVGCTNGASIVIYGAFEGIDGFYPPRDRDPYFPTNQSRIVFAATTNKFEYWPGRMFWNSTEIPIPTVPRYPYERPTLRWLNRSWWNVDRDDGVLFTQFTNVLQAVRFDRNWTNYFHLVRDGKTSTSNRVREDSFWDIFNLGLMASPARRAIMLADPLVDDTLKLYLNTPTWGFSHLEEE